MTADTQGERSLRLSDRRCEVCGAHADLEQTSAHLARVHFFCTADGRAFHASAYFKVAQQARSTAVAWEVVDAWLSAARADSARAKREEAA